MKMRFSLSLVFTFLTLLLINGCSTPPKQEQVKETKPQPKPVAEKPKPKEPEHIVLQKQILQAKNNQVWPEYLTLAEKLWHTADEQNQAAIEYQVFKTLQKLDQLTLNTLNTEENLSFSSWFHLIEASKQPKLWQKTKLDDIAFFYDDAIYFNHLLPELIRRSKQPSALNVKQVAVLLPFKGPFKKVAKQIRNGILKHQFKHYPKLVVRFYDSSDEENINSTYDLAIQEGAEKVIGPLRKANIARLSEHNAQNVIALNQVKNTPFIHFSFNSQTEAHQIAEKLNYLQHKRIGILTNDKAKNQKLAHKINQVWAEKPCQKAVFQTYPAKRPKLRKALGNLINETQSQARKNNLKWLLKEKLTFTPRVRQDLDALLFIGKQRDLAVFKPQMSFFDLKLPLFASSSISPSQYDNIEPHTDLKDIYFLTQSAVLNPTDVKSGFEAFGWDSLIIALHPEFLPENMTYNLAKRGRLYQQDQQADSLLIWAKYNQKGEIEKLDDKEIINKPVDKFELRWQKEAALEQQKQEAQP